MRLPTAMGRALADLAGLLAATAIAVASLVYYDDLKVFVAETLGQERQQVAASTSGAERERQGGFDRVVELRAGRNGHFIATAYINERAVDVLVDTGATMVALTYEDARAAGLLLSSADFTQRVNTANGVARVAPVVLETVRIGDITVRNVSAAVAEPGKLHVTLLGMTFLGKLRVDMGGGRLVLRE